VSMVTSLLTDASRSWIGIRSQLMRGVVGPRTVPHKWGVRCTFLNSQLVKRSRTA
jgi:hypothetical protein